MILPFSTEINNTNTFFVEKIAAGIYDRYQDFYSEAINSNYNSRYYFNIGRYLDCFPKLHTIRADELDRWKAGMRIHPFINNRTKNMLQIAPVMTCISTQRIQIIKVSSKNALSKRNYEIRIAGNFFGLAYKINNSPTWKYTLNVLKLANNDGFDGVEDFFDYFHDGFSGKIIHWTDLKY